MPSIIGLSATTELEAINSMLSAIGEAPIESVDDATQADVAMAINLLRDNVREVQSMGWRFNTEHGYELSPADTLAWEDTAGNTTTLNIFTPPHRLLGFKITESCHQYPMDVVVRPSRRYVDAEDNLTAVFYDRIRNRDGFDAEQFPFLYISPTWAYNFEQMPEVARRFCLIRATRQFIERIVGSSTLAGFTEKDEQLAYRNLKRDEGEEDEYNMIPSVRGAFGDRPIFITRPVDRRSTPGPVGGGGNGGEEGTDGDDANNFDPPVAGFTSQYDAMQLEGLDDGDTVATIPNFSPDAPDDSDLESVGDPGLYNSALINGHPGIQPEENAFSSGSQWTAPLLTMVGPFTLFQVVSFGDMDWAGSLFGGTFIPGARPWNAGDADYPLHVGVNDETGLAYYSTGEQPTSVVAVMTMVVDASGVGTFYLDGVNIGSSGIFAGDFVWDVRAYNNATVGRFLAIGEFLLYPSELSTDDREAIEAFLTDKWGA